MKAKKGWGFNLDDRDLSIRPQDDFFKHAHGTWLKKAKIPANESRWGSFITLRVQTEKQLKALVERVSELRAPAGSPEQMIRDFYLSGLDEKTREKNGIKPLLPYLAQIEKVKDVKGLLKLIAIYHKLGIGVLWGAMVDQDSKNSDRYALHIYQDGLGLPERDYYLKDDAESVRVRNAYMKHIEAMHRLVGMSPKEAVHVREVVMRIETRLAEASMNKEDARDSEKTYHKFSVSTLQKHAPVIDWQRYLKDTGASKSGDVVVMMLEFIKAVNGLLTDISIEDWKFYFAWHLLSDIAGALSKKFVREQFNFYGKVLQGNKKMKPIWRRALSATNGSLGELLGQLYVKEHFSVEAKKRMNELVDDLFAAYEKRINNVDWMSAATKKKALVKLRLINRKIGYPDKWKSYKGLVVRPNDFLGNLVRSTAYEHRRHMRKLGRPIDRGEWFMPPQLVNAYFSPNMNDIAFPAAILQPPFFNLFADDAVNYGSIGSVIGHEITHGFDDQGAKFDGHGNMKSWWTNEDRTQFEKRAKIIKEQFDKYEVSGVPVNGQLTLGENIADLGGVSIAFDAYQQHLERTGTREVIDGLTPEQRFFLGFAMFEQEIRRPEAGKMAALTDPHAPEEFRINGPLSNLQEFYKAYGLKKGDKLYRDPKERAKIW